MERPECALISGRGSHRKRIRRGSLQGFAWCAHNSQPPTGFLNQKGPMDNLYSLYPQILVAFIFFTSTLTIRPIQK
jgi:hypothetical protein